MAVRGSIYRNTSPYIFGVRFSLSSGRKIDVWCCCSENNNGSSGSSRCLIYWDEGVHVLEGREREREGWWYVVRRVKGEEKGGSNVHSLVRCQDHHQISYTFSDQWTRR